MSETRAPYRTEAAEAPAINWDEPYTPELVWRRIENHRYRERRRAWYDPYTYTLILPNGVVDALSLAYGYGGLLDYLAGFPESERPEIVMLCGGSSALDTPSRDDLEQPAAHGWSVAMRYDDERSQYNRAHVTYRRDGLTIELRTTAEWFGDVRDAGTLRRAWILLTQQLRGAFRDQGITLISTPGRTGIDLLERNLPRHKGGARAGWSHEYPVLSPAIRELLHATNGQGRLEFSPRRGQPEIAGLWGLDMRWAYAACLSNLPSGPVIHDAEDRPMPYAPGFYRVSGKVPRGWDRIGLLGVLRFRGDDAEKSWPRRPGAVYEGWTSSAELALAVDAGWTPSIHERILWPVTSSDPAGHWLRTLRTLRSEAEHRAAVSDDLVWGCVAHAIRAMVLQAVGFWHRRSGWAICTLPHAAEVTLPRDAELLADRSGRITFRVPVPLHDERYCHPEWSATVWGRARARLASMALRYPLSQLVALRTDGIWLSSDPGWLEDDARPGRWRLKSSVPGPLPYPASEAELLRVIREARVE